jgi:hypothetical protein
MKPKGHKVTLARQSEKQAADERWKQALHGLEGEERERKFFELMGMDYSQEPISEAESLHYWPGAYHGYLKRLWKESPPHVWGIENALRRVMEKGGPDFHVHGLGRWFKGVELSVEMEAIGKESWEMQERIIMALETIWLHFGRWKDIGAIPVKLKLKLGEHARDDTLRILEQAEVRSKQAHKLAKSETQKKKRERERCMHNDQVYNSAIRDNRGHTAPIVPHPEWLLSKACDLVPKNNFKGFIWECARMSFDNKLSWPSLHDLVIGLGMRRKEIESAIDENEKGWKRPVSTAPERPGKAIRYSPEVVRRLIERWLSRKHPLLDDEELEQVSSFYRHILDSLPA